MKITIKPEMNKVTVVYEELFDTDLFNELQKNMASMFKFNGKYFDFAKKPQQKKTK